MLIFKVPKCKAPRHLAAIEELLRTTFTYLRQELSTMREDLELLRKEVDELKAEQSRGNELTAQSIQHMRELTDRIAELGRQIAEQAGEPEEVRRLAGEIDGATRGLDAQHDAIEAALAPAPPAEPTEPPTDPPAEELPPITESAPAVEGE